MCGGGVGSCVGIDAASPGIRGGADKRADYPAGLPLGARHRLGSSAERCADAAIGPLLGDIWRCARDADNCAIAAAVVLGSVLR